MSKPYVYQYVLEGKRYRPTLSIEEWGNCLASPEHIVARTQVGDCAVSTIFLGINHQFGEGPPLVFETLVMGGPLDGNGRRYSTWEQAEAGHADLVELVRVAALVPSDELAG